MESIQLIVSEIDTGPSEIDMILEEIVETVVKESSKRKIDSDEKEENSQKKQKTESPKNEPEEEGQVADDRVPDDQVPDDQVADNQVADDQVASNKKKPKLGDTNPELKNIIEEYVYTFHIGVNCGGGLSYRKRLIKKKRQQKKQQKHKWGQP